MSQSTPTELGDRDLGRRAEPEHTQPQPDRLHGEQVDGWLRDSAISGFFATVALSVVLAASYGAARFIGDAGGNQLQRWAWALTNNSMVDTTEDRITVAFTLNLGAGIVFALIYGRFVESRMHQSPVIKGMIFSLLPFLLSVILFFPLMDGGVLGSDIGAGPLPLIGNLLVHLVYGAVLGWMYGIPLESGIDDSPIDRAANEGAERGAARGVPIGAVVGGLAAFIVSPTLDDMTNQLLVIAVGVLTGGAVGLLIGSLMGLGDLGDEEPWAESQTP